MYAIILSILMILEFVGFIMALVYKSKLKGIYKDNLKDALQNALRDNNKKVLEDFHDLEKSLKCCGATGKKDYIEVGAVVPTSCFQHSKGCANTITDWLEKNLPIIGGTLGGVFFLELLGLIGAIAIAVALKHAPDHVYSSNPGEVLAYVVPGRRRNYHKF